MLQYLYAIRVCSQNHQCLRVNYCIYIYMFVVSTVRTLWSWVQILLRIYVSFVCICVVLLRQRTCDRPIPAKGVLSNTLHKIKNSRKGERLLTLLGFQAIQEDVGVSGRSLIMKLSLKILVQFVHSYVTMYTALSPNLDGAQSLQNLHFGDCIRPDLLHSLIYNAWLHFTVHCYMHNSVHSHVFITVAC
jgi:hypothetical protein